MKVEGLKMKCNLKTSICCLLMTVALVVWSASWYCIIHSLYNTDYVGTVNYMLGMFGLCYFFTSLSFLMELFKKCKLKNYCKWFRRLIYGSMLIYFLVAAIVTCTFISVIFGCLLIVAGTAQIGVRIYATYTRRQNRSQIEFKTDENVENGNLIDRPDYNLKDIGK